ncbi:hypothetical protein SFUMM280S_07853 [Streptomyces fumanus]
MQVPAGVADFDAEAAGGRVEGEREQEAAARYAPVQDGVGGQLRYDEFGTLREALRDVPRNAVRLPPGSRASRAPRRVDGGVLAKVPAGAPT